ncbi:extracellular solute-binding protein [Neorhizobium alkalisoli]|nr:extracellular solute-binding protein [Neorhizobium alkalisoli]
MLDLNDLRLFALIAEHGGIARASRALNLPKSTLSRRLSGLEDQLRSMLVERGAETFTLTEFGSRFLQHCRDVAAAGSLAEDFSADKAQEPAGEVRLSLSSAYRALATRLALETASRLPKVGLSIEVGDRDNDQTRDGFDLSLRLHREALQDSLLKQKKLGTMSLRAVAHPQWVRRKGLPSCPQSLIHFDLIAFDSAREWKNLTFVDPSGEKSAVLHRPKLRSQDMDVVIDAVSSGAGIGILPESACEALIGAGQLVAVLPTWRADPLTVSMLTQPVAFSAAAVREVGAMLETLVRQDLGTETTPLRNRVAKLEPPIPKLVADMPARPSYTTATVRSYDGARPPLAGTVIDPEGEVFMNPIFKAAGAAMLGMASLLSMPAYADDTPGPIVLYTNDFEKVIKDRFKTDTGRDVDVVQMSGGELLARIAAEGANPQWDAVIFNGSNALYSLDQQEQLKRMVEPRNLANLNEIGKAQMPENKAWFPIGMAASCVLAYRSDIVKTAPTGFEDLLNPSFAGKVGMADPAVAAPAYPCVAQLFYAMGEEKARQMFSGFFKNGLRVFRTNGPVGKALTSGDISVALLTSQVAYSLKAGGTPIDIVWPKDGAPGSVRGVGVQAKTKRPEAAQAFVEWLLEPATQKYLQDKAGPDGLFEPTVAGAGRRADGPPEGSVYKVAPPDFAASHEEAIKTWFADQAVR